MRCVGKLRQGDGHGRILHRFMIGRRLRSNPQVLIAGREPVAASLHLSGPPTSDIMQLCSA
jgi:hypothetical protein